MKSNQQNLKASILDRLVDNEPRISHEPVQYRLVSIGHIKASVIRDLENLLNTKRQIMIPPAACKQVNRSLFVYGLPDFTSQNPASRSARQQIRRDIEKTIARFESRLKNVRVQVETVSQKDRSLKFRITALLVVEPIAEPVSFDTYFDIGKREYVISE